VAYGSGYATGYVDDVLVETPPETPPVRTGGRRWEPYLVEDRPIIPPIRRRYTVRVVHVVRPSIHLRIVGVFLQLRHRRTPAKANLAVRSVGVALRIGSAVNTQMSIRNVKVDPVALYRLVEEKELIEVAVALTAFGEER